MLLSVIIPTRNRAGLLGNLLKSLCGQVPVQFGWEIIVVDNGSTDETAGVASAQSQSPPFLVRYVLESQPGLHRGRHRGAREARGRYLAYLDDDMVLSPEWIQGVKPLLDGGVHAVVGRILPKWEDPPVWLTELADSVVYQYLGLLDLGPDTKPVDPLLVFGGNCFLPRHLVFELGGFHPDGMPPELIRFRGDGETALMSRFKQTGLRAQYEPRATAYHIVPAERLSVEYLCKRAFNQGISDSFTHLRERCLQGRDPLVNEPRLARYIRRLRDVQLREVLPVGLTIATRLISRSRNLWHPATPAQGILVELQAAYDRGYQFHQNEVRRDPELLGYIARADYLD